MTAQMTASAPATHNIAATSLVKAAGLKFAYHRFGHQHSCRW
jgi:hypothetical protein